MIPEGQDYKTSEADRTRARNWYAGNKRRAQAANRAWRERNKDDVSQKKREYHKKWYAKNKAKKKAQAAARYDNNLEQYMLERAKKRAVEYELDFNLELADVIIPEVCPVLGIPISRNRGDSRDNRPSLDRIDNAKGYTKGNVLVISGRANRLKSDATLHELRLISDFYSKIAG